MTLDTQPRHKWRYEDYAALPADCLRHEIVDGEHFVNAAPSLYHQTVSRRIQFQLFAQIERTGRGQVFNAPVDVELTDYDIVQPDLVVVLKANESILTPSRMKGSPDLLIEILSPSNEMFDRVSKKMAYERAGVAEYWIVDPIARTIEQFALRDGRYELQSTDADSLHLHVLPDVTIRLADVW
jgi:Uma2 family endonuclease